MRLLWSMGKRLGIEVQAAFCIIRQPESGFQAAYLGLSDVGKYLYSI